MALYAGNKSVARAIAQRDLRRRVQRQINGSGALPLEDGRTNSFGYHTGTVLEFLDMALLGAQASEEVIDLLNYRCAKRTEQGRAGQGRKQQLQQQ